MSEHVEDNYGTDEPGEAMRGRMGTGRCVVWTVLLSALGYVPAIAMFLYIPKFAKMFDEMLGGEPLPMITELVLSLGHFVPLGLMILTTFGIAAVWGRRDRVARRIAGLVAMLQLAMLGIVMFALFAPLMRLIDTLGG